MISFYYFIFLNLLDYWRDQNDKELSYENKSNYDQNQSNDNAEEDQITGEEVDGENTELRNLESNMEIESEHDGLGKSDNVSVIENSSADAVDISVAPSNDVDKNAASPISSLVTVNKSVTAGTKKVLNHSFDEINLIAM